LAFSPVYFTQISLVIHFIENGLAELVIEYGSRWIRLLVTGRIAVIANRKRNFLFEIRLEKTEKVIGRIAALLLLVSEEPTAQRAPIEAKAGQRFIFAFLAFIEAQDEILLPLFEIPEAAVGGYRMQQVQEPLPRQSMDETRLRWDPKPIVDGLYSRGTCSVSRPTEIRGTRGVTRQGGA
jgi:hypothetical protein